MTPNASVFSCIGIKVNVNIPITQKRCIVSFVVGCLNYTSSVNWYTSVASKSCLPLSGDAAKVEERINFGPALQPLPLATNPSPHTEVHLKSVIPSPEQPRAGANTSKGARV